MQAGPPRARRYSFVTSVELTDIQSETQIRGRTGDLSLFGCRVETSNPLRKGTRVRIRIAHGGANFVALGRVVHSKPGTEMGVVFTKIEQDSQLIIEKWLTELRARR